MAAFSVTCKECKTILKSSKPIPAGAVLTCPKCGVMFSAPAAKPPASADFEVVEDDDVIEDVEVIDDEPKKKGLPAKPAGKARVDEDRGVRPRRVKAKPKKSNTGLIIGLVAGVVGLAIIGIGGLILYKFLMTGPETPVDHVAGDAPIVGGVDLDAISKTSLSSYVDLAVNSVLTQYKRDMDAAEPKDLFSKLAFSFDGNQTEPGFLIALAAKKAYDKEKFANAFNAKAKTLAGKSGYQADNGDSSVAIVFPNSKTAVFATGKPARVDSIVSTSGRRANANLLSVIRKAETNAVWAVFDTSNSTFRQGALAGAAIPGLPKSNPEDMDKVAGMAVWANVKGASVEWAVYLGFKDKVDVTKSVDNFKKELDTIKQLVNNPLTSALIPPDYKSLAQEIATTIAVAADGNGAKYTATTDFASIEAIAKKLFDASPLKPPPPGGRPG